MLTQLIINDFAIVHKLEIELQDGMTVITGETGAGKSIAIDALGLCLGERAGTDMVRVDAKRMDICARFNLSDLSSAQSWLEHNQLDDGQECLLRRVVSHDGRSRGFINGTPVPVAQLREIGQFLIHIQGQHAYQRLLKPEYQRRLLDTYAGKTHLRQKMSPLFLRWDEARAAVEKYQARAQERQDREALLQYQLKELDAFTPHAGEYEKIDEEYRRLTHSSELLAISQQALSMISDAEEHSLENILYRVRSALDDVVKMDKTLTNIQVLLNEAAIQISEASHELRHYHECLESDPHRLHELEERLSRYVSLGHKHHVPPEQLHEYHQRLLEEATQLRQEEDNLENLTTELNLHYQAALKNAHQLHEVRTNYANELSKLVVDKMNSLSMPHAQFSISVKFDAEKMTEEGADQVHFFVSTNPGQPMLSLSKVVSGGELSRIALAIQVITACKMQNTPTLIFDEVDSGIGGATAATVGQLLRHLGKSTQVICVTHLPQVAGCGNQHFFVSKSTDGAATETHMQLLDREARLLELARLLGGSQVTENTLANARDLLANCL